MIYVFAVDVGGGGLMIVFVVDVGGGGLMIYVFVFVGGGEGQLDKYSNNLKGYQCNFRRRKNEYKRKFD